MTTPRNDDTSTATTATTDANEEKWERPGPVSDTRRRLAVGDSLRRWWDGLAKPVKLGIAVAFVIFLIFLPLIDPPLISTDSAGLQFSSVLAECARTGLIALGLNVVVGLAGLLDLGYVGFFAVGAYVVALLSSPDSDLGLKFSWLACVPIAMVVTALSGLLLGLPTLRLRGDYLAIVTLGFGEIVRLLADNIGPLKGQTGFARIAYPNLGQSASRPFGLFSSGNNLKPIDSGVAWYWLILGLVLLVMWAVNNLEKSRVGRAWIALREDEDAAEIMGVSTFKYKVWAFMIGAAIGGLSGSLLAGQVQFVNNQKFDVVTSVLFLSAVVLGGQGNKMGVLLGAFLIVYVPARFSAIAEYKFLIFGLTLIVLMLFRPQGLIPARHKLLGAPVPKNSTIDYSEPEEVLSDMPPTNREQL